MDNIIVKITSQSELNVVAKYMNIEGLAKYEYYAAYKHNKVGNGIPCFNKRTGNDWGWDQASYYEEQGCKVLSFEEFEKQYLKKEESKKPELIPGKWYKITSGKSFLNDLYYVKYKEIIKDAIKSEEYIGGCGGTEYEKGISFGWGQIDTYTWTLLENLEEIQQWLPEGHPDKIAKVEDFGYVECLETYNNQFTQGKIYKLRNKGTKDHYSIVSDDKGENNGWGSNKFKLSSKEAYDKQQNDKLVIKEEVKMADKQQEMRWSVRYCPEFTEGIFNHLLKWCDEKIKLYPKARWRGYANDRSYEDLKSAKHFNFDNREFGGVFFLCGIDNNPQSGTYISVKEMCSIIGYEQMKHPIIGEYYTVTEPRVYGQGKMIGKVITINEDSLGEDLRGKATYIHTLTKPFGLDVNKSWCYKDGGDRSFRKSTPEEIKWLEACIKANKFIPEEEAMKSEEPIMEKGKWYEILTAYSWLMKFDRINGGKIYSQKHCGTDGSSKEMCEGHWSYPVKSSKPANMEEVYKYFPEEKPKEPMKSKNVKNLLYPDVVHIESKEQWEKVNKYHKLCDFRMGYYYYLSGEKGLAQKRESYECETSVRKGERYNIFEFSELTFPEETSKKHSLEGRYLKVINDKGIRHYPCHKGDILKFHSAEGECEYWGNNKLQGETPWYFGYRAHKEHYFELMPEEWTPESDKPKTQEMYKAKVGDWIVPITPQNTGGCLLEAGKAYYVKRATGFNYVSTDLNGGDINHGDYRQAIFEEIPGNKPIETDVRKMSEEQLINEVKKRYPIGTNFVPEHLYKGGTKIILGVFDYDNLKIDKIGGNIDLYSSDNRNKESYTGRVMHYWQWSEVVESPKEKPMENYDNNWCVKLTPENKQAIINYSIKVGNRMSGTSNFYGYCKSSSFTAASSPWVKEITTEEFYQKIGVLAPKSPESDDWCVKCTKENSEILKAWTVEKGTPGMSMNDGAYYGWEKGDVAYGSWDRRWGKVLSTEEFYQKIGKSAPINENSDEALLEEAKRRYPKGTMYQPLNSDGTSYEETKEAYRTASFIKDSSDKKMGIDVGYGYVYIFENNKWAEIVSTPSGNFDYEEVRPAKIDIEFYKPKQNTQINENVTKITSISSQLVKPKKVVLF